MRTARREGFSILVAVLLFSVAASLVSAAEKITVGMVGKNQAYLPVWVGQQKGFFKDKGMDVGYSVLRALDVEAQALLAGSIQFSTSAAEGVIRLVEQGQDMKIIASLNNVPVFSLVARKEYKTLKDLKGTTLGVSGIKSGTTVLMQEIMRANGLEFPRDYKMVQVGSTQERVVALEASNVSAVMLMIPTNYLAMDIREGVPVHRHQRGRQVGERESGEGGRFPGRHSQGEPLDSRQPQGGR